MRHLLAPAQRETLRELSQKRLLLGFDFDGTLAPIVARPDAARMRPSTRSLFEAVCERYPVAVITGRTSADVSARLGPTQVRYVVGNHGLDLGPAAQRARREVNRVRPLLSHAFAGIEGVEVEDKKLSLSVHFRAAPSQVAAKRAILRTLRALPRPVRLVGGKAVINVLPAVGADKGQALLRIRRSARADAALYVGDDVTDEDVFRLGPEKGIWGIRVGTSLRTAATLYLKRQTEIDALLSVLVRLRS